MLVRWRQAGLIPVTALALVGLVVLIGLGTWQLQRKAWKEELVATIAQRAHAAPIDREAWKARGCRDVEAVGLQASCEYLAVRLTGTFEHALERHVYTVVSRVGGVGGAGYWIMTPLKLAGTGERIMVSRGFVPLERKDAATRAAGQIAGETTITGLVRGAEHRAMFTGANDVVRNTYYLRRPAEFAGLDLPDEALGEFVDLLSPVPPGGLPRPTAGNIDIPNRHLEYMLTWYGLALTLIGVFVAFALSRLRVAD